MNRSSRRFRPLASSSMLLASLMSVSLLLFSLGTRTVIAEQPKTQPVAPLAVVETERLSTHIKYLASDELEGRRSGTVGCKLAAEYISKHYKQLGLKTPNSSSYFQPFEFIDGVKFDAGSSFKAEVGDKKHEFKLGEDYIPLNFSSSGNIEAGKDQVALAGFGITASQLNYDDYAKLEAKDKVLIVLPFGPEGNNLQGKFGDYLSVRRKTLIAREKGAKAILLVSEAENLKDRAKMADDDNFTDSGVVVLNISKTVANELLKPSGRSVETLQKTASETGSGESLLLSDISLKLSIKVTREMKTTENVIGWVEGNDEKLKNEYIVIGAHYDHLGLGGRSSLAPDRSGIHHGADDNASGVAGLLELARVFSSNRELLKRSVIFVGFSGEEEGLLGSNHYVKNPPFPLERTVAMLNMDMIGRMRKDSMVVGGIGTSPVWKPMIEELNKVRGFDLKLQEDGFGPSDHASFYGKDMPVLFFFTGNHEDYHRPSDTSDKINVVSEQAIVTLV
ncbi:MAG: M28 family peptidase, partial [Blastocatellia bacterium]|nr:M28 family peptidase [Blastocatellia bacterium]